jgi:cation transport ATPase
MSQQPEFRQRLLETQATTPALRDAYQKELEAMLRPPLKWQRRIPGIVLLLILIGCVIALARNIIVHRPGPLVLTAWVTLAGTFSFVAALMLRSLWQGKFEWKWYFSVASALYMAAAMITVITLMKGMSAPSDPASTFSALYVFVFMVVCLGWMLDNRITAAELATREQMLRLESRLADLAEALKK